MTDSEDQVKKHNKSTIKSPPRFLPIFASMGIIHSVTNYLVFPRSLVTFKMQPNLQSLRQNVKKYFQTLKSKTSLLQYIRPCMFSFLFRGLSFATFDYLQHSQFLQSKLNRKVLYFINGAFAGLVGFMNFKALEYCFRLKDRARIQGFNFQFLHPKILWENIKYMLRDDLFKTQLFKQLPLTPVYSSLYFGLFYYVLDIFGQEKEELSLKNLGLCLSTTAISTLLSDSIKNATQSINKPSFLKKHKPKLSTSIAPILQTSFILFVFQGYIAPRIKMREQHI